MNKVQLFSSLQQFFTTSDTPSKKTPVLVEIAASLLLHGAVSTFIFPPGLHIAVRFVGAAAISAIGKRIILGPQHNDEAERHVARGSIVNLVGLAKPNYYLHEFGHWVASSLCYQDAEAKIAVTWFRGGGTTYVISNGLSTFGKYLGEFTSQMLIDSAGCIASTFFAMTEFAAAFYIKEKSPEASPFLFYHGVSQLFFEISYALTYVYASRKDLRHDYIKLWHVWDIHPLIPISLMIALPLVEVGILTYLNRNNLRKQVSSTHSCN